MQVNNLINSEEYFLVFEVCFNESVEDFAFSFVFKNEKGLKISGTRFPSQYEYIPIANRNDNYHIKVRFNCNLLFGNYFIDIGVKHKKKNFETQPAVLNTDALAFKVIKNEVISNSIHNWGVFSMCKEIQLKTGKKNEK